MADEREHFLRKFRQMDIDHSGVLTTDEVKKCLKASGFDKKFIKVSFLQVSMTYLLRVVNCLS